MSGATPSAFSDSPEDLIARAKEMVKEEGVPANAGVLIADLARSLQSERGARASNFAMVKAHTIDMGVKEDEIKRLKSQLENAQQAPLFKRVQELERRIRSRNLLVLAIAGVLYVLAIAGVVYVKACL